MTSLERQKRIYQLWASSTPIREIADIMRSEGWDNVSKSQIHQELQRILTMIGKQRIEQTLDDHIDNEINNQTV